MVVLWVVLGVVVILALASTTVLVRRRSITGRSTTRGATPATNAEKTAPPPSQRRKESQPEPTVEAETTLTQADKQAPALNAEEVLEDEQEEILDGSVVPGEPLEAALEEPDFKERLGRTRGLFAGLRALRGRGSLEKETWESLEEALLRADVGLETTDELLSNVRRRVAERKVAAGDGLIEALRSELVSILEQTPDRALRFDEEDGVTNVWLFVGVNGVGKTTTVGKVARREIAGGRSVLLAAGDTFRAAAGEQLELWAQRSGAQIVRGAEGSDPGAIVFDAVQRASARKNDLVLADTAGRLHTRVNLIEELKKIRRVADREPGRVTEVLLVLDATTGQNALTQAKEFTEAVGVTGIVLTKLDGTAKGGVVIAVQKRLGLPVKLVGLGEGPDDLVAFDPESFVDALVGA